MKKIFKESVLWILILMPFGYLATLWDKLPAQIPTHFDFRGTPNGWSTKMELLLMFLGLGIGCYALMIALPFLDPKKKIQQMGSKYYSLRLLITVFISALSCYILYSANKSYTNINFLFVIIGAFFVAIGNYLQAVKPNYFIGIKTPWTLENETVWRKTHKFGGKVMMVGGLLTMIIAICGNNEAVVSNIFLGIVIVVALIPSVYSYIVYRKEKQAISE